MKGLKPTLLALCAAGVPPAAVAEIQMLDDSAMGYAVDHSSRLFLIDRDGALAGTLVHDSTPTELGQWLQRLLGDKESRP